MPAWLCILVAALIVWLSVSSTAAVLLGKVIARRDTQTPPVRAGGEDPAHRRAQLRVVR